MFEQYLEHLGNRVTELDKKHNRHSPRFVGYDMYPQFQSNRGWSSQTVDDRIYISYGDFWVSQETYKFISCAPKHILTLSSCIYIIGIYAEVSTFSITLGQTKLDIDKNSANINYILYPGEGYEIETDTPFTIEINYRELL